MNAKARIRLSFSSEKQLTALINALTPEIQKQIGTRSRVTLERNSLFLFLNVDAQDTVALRAALNAYLRWINSALKVLDFVDSISFSTY